MTGLASNANWLPGRAAWQDLTAPEVFSDADLVVDPGRPGRGPRRAVLATARADLRCSTQPHLQATRRRYRRRVRPLGPLAPAGVHPRRRQAAVRSGPGRGDRGRGHWGLPASEAVAAAPGRAVRLRVRPRRQLGPPVLRRRAADRPGRGSGNPARHAAALLGLRRHSRPVPAPLGRRRRRVTSAQEPRAY